MFSFDSRKNHKIRWNVAIKAFENRKSCYIDNDDDIDNGEYIDNNDYIVDVDDKDNQWQTSLYKIF
jgi:hypothetical protein